MFFDFFRRLFRGAPAAGAQHHDGVQTVFVACETGVGSGVTGASLLRKKLQDAQLDIEVRNCAINDLPEDARLVITHQDLTERARALRPAAEHLSLRSFLDRAFYDQLVVRLKAG